jgi:hypothetical protein
MIRVLFFQLAYRLIGFRAGLSLLGYQQDRTKKGQCDCLALSCCIAAQQRSSRSSALLYPLLGNRDSITRYLCRTKMGYFSFIKWSPFR